MAVPGLIFNRRVVSVIDSMSGLAELEREWRVLWQSDPAATPFQSPDWLIPWTQHLWGGGKLRIVTFREAERLVAVAPFFLWGFGSTPQDVRLSWLGSGVSDYLGMTCAPDHSVEAGEELLEWLKESSAEWDSCDLQELRPGSPLLEAASRAGCVAGECSVCPVLPLRASFAEQLAGAPSKFRRDLQTAEKRLRAAGEVEIVRAGNSERQCLLDRLFELHTGRWKERGECGMFSTAALRSFHEEVARRFCDAGILRLFGLILNGQPIAVQYNFGAKGRVYAYQAGFDPAFARSSPGAVLLARSIENAIEEGAREFDFLRHAEEFKYAWGATDTFTKRLWFTRAGILDGKPAPTRSFGTIGGGTICQT